MQATISKDTCCKNKMKSLSLTDTVSDGIFQWYSFLQFVPTLIGISFQTEYPKEYNKYVITDAPPDVKHTIRALHQVYII